MKRIDLIDLVLDAGADIDAPDPSGATPLGEAIGQRDPLIVVHLLDRGAKLNARNHFGHTPISSAASISTPAVVGLLLDRGADPLDSQHPALVEAASRDRDDIIQFLATRGITPDRPGSGGARALTLAQRSGAKRAAAALLALGAVADVPTTAPSAALDLAPQQ